MSSPSHHMTDNDFATPGNSVSSSPRSSDAMQQQPRVRFMCSFGGKIFPRPQDDQLRYIGGDTHIVAVHRHTTFNALLSKLAKSAGTAPVAIKYQLPNEDLDTLISVSTDEDVENMMEEYDRFSATSASSKTPRLRLFLFPVGGSDHSRRSSISPPIDGSSTRRGDWFFDDINGGAGGAGLKRGRSESSSVVSEVPDYLFGLDYPVETGEHKAKPRPFFNDNVSIMDAGSLAPRSSSPFGSNSSDTCVPSMSPEFAPVRTIPENPTTYVETREIHFQPEISCQQTGYAANPMWHYTPEVPFTGPTIQPLNVYYVPAPIPPIQIEAPYIQQFGAAVETVPMGLRPPTSGFGSEFRVTSQPPSISREMRGGGVMGEEANVNQQHQQQMYYYGNGGMVQVFPGMTMPVGADLQRGWTDPDVERVMRVS